VISTHGYLCFGLWIFSTKIVKLIPHFWRHPTDVRFIPLLIAFSYAHGFLDICALCTMRNTVWGSQDLKQLEGLREEDVASETGENNRTNGARICELKSEFTPSPQQ
jgi:hypothetical protein